MTPEEKSRQQIDAQLVASDRIRQITIKLPLLAEQTRIVAEVDRRLSVVQELDYGICRNRRQNVCPLTV
jgi:hypothetical protein